MISLAVSDMGRSVWAEPEFERLSPVLGGFLARFGAWRQAWPLLSEVLAAETLSPFGPARWLSEHGSGRGETAADVELQLAV